MIYLDNNATTPLSSVAAERISQVSEQGFGNPGSRHEVGRKARRFLEDSREEFASLLGAHPDELIFTSGGTEASNLAIYGLTAGRTGDIALPGGEHPATNEPVRRRIKEGCRRVTLPIDRRGQILEDELKGVDWSATVLATSLMAHNEIGTIRDLNSLANLCREHRVPLHVDAVQAVGKIPVNFEDSGATTMAIGAHKFHGPRGIGALLVRRQTRLVPTLLGGHQEQGFRPGTEPVALIAGMVAALKECENEQTERTQRLTALRDQLQSSLLERCPFAVVNGDPNHRLPNTLHISFPGCNADALLVALDLAEICCSLGSACASGSTEPSPVLLAMGLPESIYSSSVRFSIGVQNTMDEMHEAANRVAAVVTRIRQVGAQPSD